MDLYKDLNQAKARTLPPAEVTFDYGKHSGRISILEPFRGKVPAEAFAEPYLPPVSDGSLGIGSLKGKPR